MKQKKHYTIKNSEDIESYLRGFANGDELLAHHLCQSLKPSLSMRPENLRPLNEEEKKEVGVSGNPLSKEAILADIRQNVLNSELYVFDPSLDPALEQKVKNIIEFIRVTQIIEQDNWGNGLDQSLAPVMLRDNFLQAALNAPVIVSSSTQEQEILPAKHEQASLPAKHEQASLPAKVGAVEEVMNFDDGWRIVKYCDFELFRQDNNNMDDCMSDFWHKIDRVSFDYDDYTYYALSDPDGITRVMFKTTGNDLLKCKGYDGYPPENQYSPYVRDFVKRRNFKLCGEAQDHGMLEKDGEYYNVFDLPDGFSYDEVIWLQNIKKPFTLNLERVGCIWLNNSSGLQSLGKLKYAKFINIEGTSVTEIPETLKVKWNQAIWTDLGDFHIMSNARRAFKEKYGRNQPKSLPAPEEAQGEPAPKVLPPRQP